jgi:hypothetical protein
MALDKFSTLKLIFMHFLRIFPEGVESCKLQAISFKPASYKY